MKGKILILSAAALMTIGAVAYGIQSREQSSCPLEGKPDCPNVNCPLKGTPLCPNADEKEKIPSCCQKQ